MGSEGTEDNSNSGGEFGESLILPGNREGNSIGEWLGEASWNTEGIMDESLVVVGLTEPEGLIVDDGIDDIS